MRIVSLRENPEFLKRMTAYFQSKWANENSMAVYEDCLAHCAGANSPLPQWYLLMENDEIAGCAGLIANDFISRSDLYPWLCALYIEEKFRGNSYGNLLIAQAEKDAKQGGFDKICLCTDHIGYYEHYGFEYIGTGYHPWGDTSRIYMKRI